MNDECLYREILAERISFLKSAKVLANKLLHENLAARTRKHPQWQEKVISKNIEQLKEHISAINKARHSKALSDFVVYQIKSKDPSYDISDRTTGLMQSVRTFTLLFDIAKASLSYSVIHDLYWIKDGAVTQHIDIAIGKRPISILADYCDDVIFRIESIAIPYLRTESQYTDISMIAEEIVSGFENRSFIATNILLPSLIEGLARKFLIKVYLTQNPHKTLEEAGNYVSRFQSLENLITKGDWKDDISISFFDAIQRGSYIDDPQLIAAKNMHSNQARVLDTLKATTEKLRSIASDRPITSSELEEKFPEYAKILNECIPQIIRIEEVQINISVRVELQFLIRRYKDVRNRIVHGNLEGSNEKWECYLNLNMFHRLYECIHEYHNAHP